MSSHRLPSLAEHLRVVSDGIAEASRVYGRPTLGNRGVEVVLLRIEAQNAQVIDLLGQLVELAEGQVLPAAPDEVGEALQPAPDLDALGSAELRALCDEHEVTDCDRRSKRSMRDALRAHGLG